jgi:hypothetical protein
LGPFEIANDGGPWVGTMVGTSNIPAYYELVGTGAYEGFSAIVLETATDRVTEDGLEVFIWEGEIVPGNLPPER